MIVRILGEGQFDVADAAIERLNTLDAALEVAIEANDESAFSTALSELLGTVRSIGEAHPADEIDTSDIVLPHEEATIDEVRELLDDDGLIPG